MMEKGTIVNGRSNQHAWGVIGEISEAWTDGHEVTFCERPSCGKFMVGGRKYETDKPIGIKGAVVLINQRQHC